MIERAAFRAGLGRVFLMAAMVALQLPAKPVLHQPGRTFRALETVAADPAERQRRIAPAIEKEQRLFAASPWSCAIALDHHRRQEAAARRGMRAHVDETEIRHRRAAETVARCR